MLPGKYYSEDVIMGQQSFTLGKERRCKSRKLIEKIFREGKSFAVWPFRVYYYFPGDLRPAVTAGTENNTGNGGKTEVGARTRLQAGFGASSRNFKRAVDRNRIKRLMREAYRLQRPVLEDRLEGTGRQVALFFIYTGKELPEYQVVSEKIGVILQKLIKELAA